MVTVIIQRDGEDLFIELVEFDEGGGWKEVVAFLPDGRQVDLTGDELDEAISLANAGVDYTGTDE
jgi:hypothetical protein